MAAAEELALKLAKGPPLAISKAKEVIYRGLSMDFEAAVADVMQEVAFLSQTEDHQEAVRAFLEKREPVFKGR
jgi:enoyl-CoA hydratase/carnithine racemase